MADDTHPRVIAAPDALPILPLRDTVLFPLAVAPILVGQERSIRLVREVMTGPRLVALVAQRVATTGSPPPEALYGVGTMALIHEVQELAQPQVMMRIAVQGLQRVRLHEFIAVEPFLVARIQAAPDLEQHGLDVEAQAQAARDLFVRLVPLVPELPDELTEAAQQLPSPLHLLSFIATTLSLPTPAKQELLELDGTSAKLRRLVELLRHELAVRQVAHDITAETSAQMSKDQREAILRRQMEAIRHELGETDPDQAEAKELQARLAAVQLPEETRKEVDRELGRLERIPSASPEHGLIRTYLDWVLKLPWGRATGRPIDLERARGVLDEDHYDLEKVKERILEYLAVKKLRDGREARVVRPAGVLRTVADGDAPVRPPGHEPILCFVGPPGVGKTSLGQSIARAMGRRFIRMSLGGIHDEAEIRGHRRTYIGAMPGRILQALARTDAANPVFMLDEVDKLGVGYQGDPSAALLEVLDPAQNHAFVDSYLGLPFDLSQVLFIATANSQEAIPAPLLDRMEVLVIAGYTELEKGFIARRFLVPKQVAAHGLRPEEVLLDDAAVARVIRDHTREAGVRNLERELAAILRKVARRVGEGAQPPVAIGEADVPGYLGPPRFYNEVAERIDRPGVATGLAWTPNGGEILFVEAAMTPNGQERLLLTGMLGDVMRESAQTALTYLRSNAGRFGFDGEVLRGKVVHVHVPAGAIPKDGPSAGVAILAALASLASGRPVRSDVAMTGEITLRGKVLPVGGIKEKVLAARRVGISTVILPRHNESALEDLPEEVRRDTRFVFVESGTQVIDVALERPEPVVVVAQPSIH